ncbi:MAG: hypothetical protein B7Y40_03525 [Gammaproteobacteria bacterium 28-57-27]|nr:MAG: hypothetical protein B7Y40_03525 [Gammaproteobacteria bacterium 28-57-27]
MMLTTLYEHDFYGWVNEQARLLKTRQFQDIDIEHLIEEIESMGKSEKRQLKSRLRVLLMHLLKWSFQPSLRSHSWKITMRNQRRDLAEHLLENPSLKNELDSVLTSAYAGALGDAESETGLNESTFPAECPWTFSQIIDPGYLPD